MLQRISKHINKRRRELWLWWQRKRLKSGEFTLIASNCIGGIIYHDLGIQFQSPTINLDIPPQSFLTMCEHLQEYLNLPIEPMESNENCPVGVIHGQYGDVQINFRHYKTLQEGIDKWEQRKARMHWDKLFVILEDQQCDKTIAERFEQLPFENKVLYSSVMSPSSACMPASFYGHTYYWGKILAYPDGNIHRYLEQLDYVAFLNGKGIRLRNLNLFSDAD